METFRPGDHVVAIHTDLSAPIYAPRPQTHVFQFPDGPLQRRVIYHVEEVLTLKNGSVGLYIAGLRVLCNSQEITWYSSRFRKVQPVRKSTQAKTKRITSISCPLSTATMEIFVSPRDWAHSTSRLTPTHTISLQNPESSPSELAELRPSWIPEENHYIELFHDADAPESPRAPTRGQITALIDWLFPLCSPESESRLLIHCDADLGRSTAAGYIASAIHLGPGNEPTAFQQMIASSLKSQLVPNSIIIAHADAILARSGALQAPLTDWNRRVTWRRTFR